MRAILRTITVHDRQVNVFVAGNCRVYGLYRSNPREQAKIQKFRVLCGAQCDLVHGRPGYTKEELAHLVHVANQDYMSVAMEGSVWR